MERLDLGFRNRWWFAAAVATATVVGVVLRLAGTGDRTLFWDEAYHLRLVASNSLTETLGAALANPPSDPLYALILRAWVGVAGGSDFVVRLPSVAFAAGTILATAWLALELTRDRRVAVASALLVALAPYAVEYGQEASLYSLAAMTTTLALAAGWRWRRTGRRVDAGVFIGLSVVAVYSHYVVAVVLVLVGLLSLTRLGGPRAVTGRQIATCASIVAVAWLPWLVPMLSTWAVTEVPRTALPHSASLSELVSAASQYATGSGALLQGVRPVQILGIAAAAVLLLRGWLVGRAPQLGGLRVVVVSAAILFIAPWLASALTGRWLFVAHMMLFVLPAMAVVLAAGALIREPGRARLTRYVAPVALGLLFVAQLAGLAVNAVFPPHGADGSRDLADVLASRAAPGEPVVITPNEQQIIFERYWNGSLAGLPRDIDLRALYRHADVEADLAATIARYEELTGSAQTVWLVYTPAREADRLFVEWLGRNRSIGIVAERPFGQVIEIRRLDSFLASHT